MPPPSAPAQAFTDEEELLRTYATTRDETAREELVRRFMPFARGLAMRYAGGVEPTEDLVQVASLGLVGALERYDPDHGVPFTGFAAPAAFRSGSGKSRRRSPSSAPSTNAPRPSPRSPATSISRRRRSSRRSRRRPPAGRSPWTSPPR
jgi:RNA polymerase sigma-B factor